MVATNARLHVWPIRDWRIGFRVTFFFLLLTLLPIALFGWIIVTLSRDAMLNQGIVSLQSASHSTAQRLDAELAEQRAFVTVIGRVPEIVRYSQNPSDAAARDAALKVLKVAANKAPSYESVAVVNSQGAIILSSAAIDLGTNVGFRPYFQEALRGASSISDPSISVITNHPAIFYSAPVTPDSATVIAVVRSRVKVDRLWELVEEDDGVAGTGSFGMLLDENGIRLAHSSSRGNRKRVQEMLLFRAVAPLSAETDKALVAEKRFGKVAETQVQVLPLDQVAARLTSADTSVFQTKADTNSEHNQAVMIKLQNKPWGYLVGAPLTTFTAQADRAAGVVLVFFIFVGVIAFLTAVLISRSITRPIVQLTQAANRISLGDLDTKVVVSRRDEIGELADAFSRMQANLQAAIERLRKRDA